MVLFVSYADAASFEGLADVAARELQHATVLTVVPDISQDRPLGQALARACAAVGGAVLRYAPTAESLFLAWDSIRETRALSLPLPHRALRFVAAADIAAAVKAHWTAPVAKGQIVGPSEWDGDGLAVLLETMLHDVLQPDSFLRARLHALDLNQDGKVTTAELHAFLQKVGQADGEESPWIDGLPPGEAGIVSLERFRAGFDVLLETALDREARDVFFHRDLPHFARDRWAAAGVPLSYTSAVVEHLYYPAPVEAVAFQGETHIRSVLQARIVELVDLFVLPGRGLLSRRTARFGDGLPLGSSSFWPNGDPCLDEVATFSQLTTLEGRVFDIRRSARGVRAAWRDAQPTERIRFGEGDQERELALEDGRLVGMSCRGRWAGMGDTMVDLLARRRLRAWERALFCEMGAIHIAHAQPVIDPKEMICHCVGVNRATLVAAAERGAKTVAAICAKTRATSVCGGCIPLVEELLGSPRMGYAELVSTDRRSPNIVTLTLRPIESAPMPSKAGQHIVVQAYIGSRWVTRAYTLTSRANTEAPYEITVKREALGVFSRFLADRASPQTLFRCSQPTGDVFVDEQDQGPIFVFAGGIGITPGIAISRTLADEASRGVSRRRLHVDWSVRKATDLVFAVELDALAAAYPSISWTRRVTSTEKRLDAATIAAEYPYVAGAVALVCGPDAYASDVRRALCDHGWPEAQVRVEVFTSNIDNDGNAQPVRPSGEAKESTLPPVHSSSFYLDLREDKPILFEAESFLGQMYAELGVSGALGPRMEEVREEVARTGTWTHTSDELAFGARLAWRNATRCVGRFFWKHLVVRDMRHLVNEEDIFQALVDHLRVATNGGDLVSTITVFRTGAPDIRLYNTQLLRYAGYRQADGTILGDPANVELTDQALALGWRGKGTRFDILPLMVRVGDRPPQWFEIPDDAILRVPIVHPDYAWFSEMELEWYALPAVSEIGLDLGGVVYRSAPFNGFYMSTEIGARNFSDANRYNLLPEVARRMGLNMASSAALWKDRAMVELNTAVLYSFQQKGVRILDHHSACDYFLQFERQEKAAGRPVYGDWSWLVPPMSGSASPLWLRSDLQNVVQKPMYGYQSHAWKEDAPPPDHEGPIPPCPHIRGRR